MQKSVNAFDPSIYTIEVRRIVNEDGACYEARVKEIPGIASYADCGADAYEEARDAIVMLYTLAQEHGQSFPQPLTTEAEDFSGRVTLRISKSLHQRAHQHALREGISLNGLISEALAEKVSPYIKAKSSIQNVARNFFNNLMPGDYQASNAVFLMTPRKTEQDSYGIARIGHGI